MTNPPTINAESELVARLLEIARRDDYGAEDIREAAATIERLASAHEQGRRKGIEMAAKVADGHKGLAAAQRRAKTLKTSYRFASDEAKLEIQAEERGEDVASEEIAAAIRALSSAPPGEKGERIPSGALTDAERAIIDRELARHEDSAAAAESTGAFESERFHDAMVKALRLAASPPPAKAEDGMREVYNPLIAAELRTIALSAGGGDSATGLLILGLLDQYETRIGGPRAISNQGD